MTEMAGTGKPKLGQPGTGVTPDTGPVPPPDETQTRVVYVARCAKDNDLFNTIETIVEWPLSV